MKDISAAIARKHSSLVDSLIRETISKVLKRTDWTIEELHNRLRQHVYPREKHAVIVLDNVEILLIRDVKVSVKDNKFVAETEYKVLVDYETDVSKEV